MRILHLEDDIRDAELVEAMLRGAELACEITCAKTRQAFERLLAEQTFDLILCDYGLPGYDGASALNAVRSKDRNIPFIVLSGSIGEEQAVETLRNGATDYLLKNRLERLVPAVTRALREAHEREIRKKAEEALRESEARFRQLAESIQEVFWITTADMSQILYVSPAYHQIWGRSVERLYQHPYDWIDAIVSEDRQRVIDTFKSLEQGARAVDVEYRIRRPDDSMRWILDRGFAIRDQAGKVYRTAGVAKDITERKQAEEENRQLELQLRQAQKLEAIGTLAGGIAHDFNNILGAIIGYTELAQEDIAAEHRSRKRLQEVLKAGHRAKELVQQILAFSRQSVPERKPVAIALIIKEALKLLRATLPATIQIRTELDTKHDRVVADPVQVHQVLMNLCTNAAHAMHEKGGTLTVGLNELTITEEDAARTGSLPTGAYLKLSVRDTGHGMEKAVQDRIFDPFFTTKPLGEGTGLGLSVVHGIVTSHGGQISVSSEPGAGTTFEIVLPQTTNVVEMAQQNRPDLPRGTERVLLIDDEEPLANLLRERLERFGYKVVAETDSLRALQLFQAAPASFDIVLSDQTMPGMTGVELAKRIRRVRNDLPIFLFTGYSEALREDDVQTISLCQVVLKPVDLQALHAAIRRVLNQKHDVAC